MSIDLTTLQVDTAIAAAINARAARKGQSVSELLAELLGGINEDSSSIAELDCRWARARAASHANNDEVVAWLDTWGTADFRPWNKG